MTTQPIIRRAVVVGATSGIGRAVALQLGAQGWRVGITGRRTGLLDTLKAWNPEAFLPATLDVTAPVAELGAGLDALAARLGGIDLLVLAAGWGDENPALDPETEHRTIEVNVTGFTFVAGWVFRYFAAQGHGHLVTISSVAGLRGSSEAPAYNATKAYQINYLEALRQKAAKLRHSSGREILTTDIRPGFVDTAMAKGEGLFWVAPPEKAAQQIIRAISRRRKVAYVTRRWSLVGWFLKRVPRWLYDKM